MLNNYFLLFFYTDVIRIPSAAATVIFLIARVWDAINDPMMGVICDSTKHEEGRSRFWLKRLCAPAAICILLSYMCPEWATPAKVLWAGVTYIFQGMAQTAIGIPLNSLRVSMTENRVERIKLSQYMAISGAVANFVVPAYTLSIVNTIDADHMWKGFAIIAGIIGVLYGSAAFLTWKTTRGYDPDTSRKEDHTDESAEKCNGENSEEQNEGLSAVKKDSKKKISGMGLISAALKNRYCVLVCLTYGCYLLLSGIMGSTLVYYFRYNLKNDGLMSIYSATVTVGALLAVLAMRVMGKKFGNARTCSIGGIIAGLGLVARIATSDQIIAVFAVAMLFVGFGSGIVSNMLQQCILDATTYGKLHGADNQSVVMSLFTFAQKFGQAVSSVLAAALLAVFHYTAGAEPTTGILRLFYVENLIFPIAILVIVLVLLAVIDRLEKQMLTDLEALGNK